MMSIDRLNNLTTSATIWNSYSAVAYDYLRLVVVVQACVGGVFLLLRMQQQPAASNVIHLLLQYMKTVAGAIGIMINSHYNKSNI